MTTPINVLEYRKRILAKVFSHLPISGREFTVDVGCGDGGDCVLLSQSVQEVIGLDVECNSKWRQEGNDKIEFCVADAGNLQFVDETFDLVFEKDMLHHVNDPLTAIRELLRVTKIGGRLVCIEGNRYNPILYLHMTLMLGHQHFKKSTFEKLVKKGSADVFLLSVESRVYPTKNKHLLNFAGHIGDLLEKLPFVNHFLCYNIAIIKKE